MKITETQLRRMIKKRLLAEWSWIFLDKDSPIITPSGFEKAVSTTQEELAASWVKAKGERK